MGKRAKIGFALLMMIVVGAISWDVARRDESLNPGYAAYLRTARLRDRLAKYEFSSVYQTLSRWTGSNPARTYRLKAQTEEQALWTSGTLVSLTFWAPMSRPLTEIQSAKHFRKVLTRGGDTVTVLCLPKDTAELQALFCCITNRVPRAPLTRLAEFEADDILCCLPDGSVEGIDKLQSWLNDSIVAGWSVGVASRFSGTNTCLLATRQRPPAEPLAEKSGRSTRGTKN